MRSTLRFQYLLMGIVSITLFFSSCKPEKINDLELVQESNGKARTTNCAVTITGNIKDTKNLQPLANATIKSNLFSATTDNEGNFTASLKIEKADTRDVVKVTKDGYLTNEFPVYYDAILAVQDCANLTNVEWNVTLSERKECNWISERDGAWYKVMDTVAYVNNEDEIVRIANIYTIDVRRGTFKDWVNLCISPDHSSATGRGIPPSHKALSAGFFVIEDYRGLSRNSAIDLVFEKPVEMNFGIPSFVDKNGNLFVLDVDDLTVDETATAIVRLSENDIYMEIKGTGKVTYFYQASALELAQKVLTATQSGATVSGIEETYFQTIQNTDLFNIDMDQVNQGRVETQIFGNCECNNGLISFTATPSLRGNEGFFIRFPTGTPNDTRSQAYEILNSSFNDSGNATLSGSLNFTLEACQSATVTSSESIHRTSGTVMGFTFTYESTSRLQTTVDVSSSCAHDVDSSCHQGC